MNHPYLYLLFFMTGSFQLFSQTITGSITDTEGKSLENVVVTIVGNDAYSITDNGGNYTLELPAFYKSKTIKLVCSLLGYDTVVKEIHINEQKQSLNVVLQAKNLQLKEIQVVALSKDNGISNSSIGIDQEAIELTQANSLRDVFSLLPGQEVINSDLQNAQTIALRTTNTANTGSSIASEQKRMASFGTAIIIDGVNQSNNAALEQAGSISGNNGIRFANGLDSSNPTSVANGLDLRTLATENIESIEVVAGVASAKYSDFSDGAVIVNQKAGIAPWRLTARNQPGLINTSLSKGFDLQKSGQLNVSSAYIYDNSDPTVDLKSFSRLTNNAIWSVAPTSKWKNTLSVNYTTNLDESKTDPEINEFARGEYQSNSFRIANRGIVQLKNKLGQTISYNAFYNRSSNQIFEENLRSLNDFIWTTASVEEGESEGFLVRYPFVTNYTIDSKLIQIGATLNHSMSIKTGSILHQFSQGFNINQQNNRGNGTMYDLTQPYFVTNPGLYAFSVTKPDQFERRNLKQTIWGGYLEDKFSVPIANKELDLSLGIRGDQMNEVFTLSPRLSSNLDLTDNLRVGLAYGRNAKSAPLAYISPNRGFYEFPLIDVPYFQEATATSPEIQYYPVQTVIVDTTFTKINPMVSEIVELSTKIALPMMNITANVFHKTTDNGFQLVNEAFAMNLPIERVTDVQNGNVITTTIGDSLYFDDYRIPTNGLSSKTQGIELLLHTNKIKAIATSFDLNSAFTWGEYRSSARTTVIPSDFRTEQTSEGIYLGERLSGTNSNDFSMRSALTSITHIETIGLIATLRTEAFWFARTENNTTSLFPTGYYDSELNYFEIPEEQRTDQIYAPFRVDSNDDTVDETGSFFNFHLKLAKEVSPHAKLSFYANNFLNYRPIIENQTGSRARRMNQEPQFGGELTITLNK